MRNLATSRAATLLLAAIVAATAARAYIDLGASLEGDCRQARDPQRCAARLEARAACRDKRGLDRHQCLAALMPPPDCRKAADPARCHALAAARAACKGKAGAEFPRCVCDRMPGWRGYQSG